MLDLGCYVSLLMCTCVRMGQKLASMCKNNYCRGLTKEFYHCGIVIPIPGQKVDNLSRLDGVGKLFEINFSFNIETLLLLMKGGQY
jgi:hypothetical protein